MSPQGSGAVVEFHVHSMEAIRASSAKTGLSGVGPKIDLGNHFSANKLDKPSERFEI
jgi:hypothetical protein